MASPQNTAQHTAAPWTWEGTDVYGADAYSLADVASVHLHKDHDADAGHWNYEDGSAREFTPEEEEANARLIAAAPEAPHACVPECPGEQNRRKLEAYPDLLAALEEIAKGEGRFNRDPLEHATNTIEDMQSIARAAIAKAHGEVAR